MSMMGPKNALPGADQVSRAYRAAKFDEEPPAELDRVILAAARRQRHRPLASYLPPLALAATVVLSVSLVLRSGVLNEDAEIISDDAAPATGVRAVPISAVRELEEPIAAEETMRFREEISLDGPTAPALRARPVEMLPLTTGIAASVKIGCADVDHGQADIWLACISARLRQSDDDDARRELQAFAEAYPDYSLPEDLETLLVP